MKRIAILTGLLLSACTQPGTPVPDAARLSSGGAAGDRLEVDFTDGRTCRALVAPGAGQGVFENCPEAQEWSVAIRHRNLLEPIFGAAVTPYADIAITSASGRITTFRVPTGGER